MKKINLLITIFALFFITTKAQAAAMEDAILDLQQRWAVVKYKDVGDQQKTAIKDLSAKAEEVANAYPAQAEPLIWQAIIVSTDAGITGGINALSKVKQARDLLLKAEKINPKALDGSIYTSLGSLYYKVPGWPIGFGDKKKAEEYLQKSLAINAEGIDINFFYGEFLFEQKDYKKSYEYLQKALNAKPRPNRELADSGRKKEIADLLVKVKAKL